MYFYSDKLANQQVATTCLYFCCTVVHREENMSAKQNIEKACLWSKMSGIQMVRQVMGLYHLNTRHPKCPVFK